MIALGLICIDYQWLEKSFGDFKVQLQNVRFDSLYKNKVLLVKFEGKQMTVSEYSTGKIIKSTKIPALKKVLYNTKAGSNTIVFNRGTTSSFNLRIHGGEIVLGSWLGFKKHIHVNCAGYIQEGKYPEE